VVRVTIESCLVVVVLGQGLLMRVKIKRLRSLRLKARMSPPVMVSFGWGVMEFRFLTEKVFTLLHFVLDTLFIFLPLFAPAILLSLFSIKISLFLPVESLFVPMFLLHHGPVGLLLTSGLLFIFSALVLALLSFLFPVAMAKILLSQ